MKKFYFLSLLLLGGFVLGSCGDDDDDNGGGNSSAGVIDSKLGIRLKSLGDYRFYYTDSGRLDYVSEGSYDRCYEFDYSSNTIAIAGEGDDNELASVSYNGSGYITSIKDTYSKKDEYYDYMQTGTASLSYDGGHLTKISINSKETGIEDGEQYTETASATFTFSWKNNRLTAVDYKYNEKSSRHEYSGTEWYRYDYTDADDNENIYMQYAPSITRWGEDIWEVLAFVGLLGNGPKVLPSVCEYGYTDYEDGELDEEHESSKSYRYRFNADGTIATCYVGNQSYNYTYESDDDDYYNGRATRSLEKAQLSLRDLFRCHRHRR